MKKLNRNLVSRASLVFSAFAMVFYLVWGLQPKVDMPVVAQDPTLYDNYQIVLLDVDQMLIPLTVQVDNSRSLTAQFNDLISMMKNNQTLTTELKGFFDNDVMLNEAIVKGDTLTLDFNSAFLKYEKEHELKILETLVFLGTQFQVTKIKVLVDHFLLQYMPMKNTVVNQPLSKKIGINNFMNHSERLNHSTGIQIFYQKNINGTTYLVPQTKRINKQKVTMEVLLDEIISQVFVSSLLEQPLHNERVSFAKKPLVEEEKLTLYFQPLILEEERVINDLYLKLLLLSIRANTNIRKVKLMVGEEIVGLGGMNEEFIDVYSILYNILPTNKK